MVARQTALERGGVCPLEAVCQEDVLVSWEFEAMTGRGVPTSGPLGTDTTGTAGTTGIRLQRRQSTACTVQVDARRGCCIAGPGRCTAHHGNRVTIGRERALEGRQNVIPSACTFSRRT